MGDTKLQTSSCYQHVILNMTQSKISKEWHDYFALDGYLHKFQDAKLKENLVFEKHESIGA